MVCFNLKAMRWLALCAVVAGGLMVSAARAADTAALQAQAIRYMDLTTREDGWGTTQLAAAQASRGKQVVIVSYLDPQQTRKLYDAAVRFMQKTAQPRVVGVIRSPGVPANVTQNAKNPLGFDVFFDGSTAPPPVADPRFTRTEELEAALRVIHNRYFAKQNR